MEIGVVLATLIAFVISAGVAWWLAHPRSPLRILDHPNARSLHQRPVPRTGGLAILAGLAAGGGTLLALGAARPGAAGWPAVAALAVLAAVSFIDDRRHIAPGWRLLVQIAVAVVLAGQVYGDAGAGFLVWPLLVLFLVWMINLYNFMDGMDGFAAGMAVAGFGTLALIAGWQGAFWLSGVCGVVAAAALGFLVMNFPPARLFMGDLGSTLLGAMAGVMLLLFHREGILPVWLGGLVFSPFIVDATVTLVRRILRGERFWEAHRQHYYQRLVRRGWGHRKTLLAEYALMLASAASAVAANGLPPGWQWGIIGAWSMIYAMLMIAVDRTEPEENEAAPV